MKTKQEVCIRTVDGARVCGVPVRAARKNPSRMAALATMPYLRDPSAREVRNEMIRGPEDETLDEAISRLSDLTGESSHTLRVQALQNLAVLVQRKFTRADVAIKWITKRNHRLGLWCGTHAARWALAQIPPIPVRKHPTKRDLAAIELFTATERMISAQEGLVYGKGTIQNLQVLRAIVGGAVSATFKVRKDDLTPLRVAAEAAVTPYPFDAAMSAAKVYAYVQASKEGTAADYPFSPSFEANVERALRELVGVVANAIIGFPVDIYWRA